MNKRRLYKVWKKFIFENETELNDKFRLRRDYSNYLYTIVNIKPEEADKYYAENERISQAPVNKYISKVEKYFIEKNMQEFIAIRNIERLNDYNWKVEFGFSLFDSKKKSKRKAYSIAIAIILFIIYSLFSIF